jgi:SMODS-associating 2TM, beta-strand rich effector domain
MKPYKLNIKLIIASVGIFSLLIFSVVLIIFHFLNMESVTKILLEYAYIIAPTSLLWIFFDKYLWHTRLFQSIRAPLNIPPDIRGRWEGSLENADGSEPQKFVIEIKQTLTTMVVHTFTSIGHSASILSDIAVSEHEDKFALCYLWQGELNTSMKDIHQREIFHGYTMLNLHEHETPKVFKGFYFTNRPASQTRGGIELTWVSYDMKRKLG